MLDLIRYAEPAALCSPWPGPPPPTPFLPGLFCSTMVFCSSLGPAYPLWTCGQYLLPLCAQPVYVPSYLLIVNASSSSSPSYQIPTQYTYTHPDYYHHLLQHAALPFPSLPVRVPVDDITGPFADNPHTRAFFFIITAVPEFSTAFTTGSFHWNHTVPAHATAIYYLNLTCRLDYNAAPPTWFLCIVLQLLFFPFVDDEPYRLYGQPAITVNH